MFKGTLTALVTPLKNGTVDEDGLAKLIEQQLAAGIEGLVVIGTTGESATLTTEEKSTLMRVALEATQKRVPVIAGVGANSTAVAVEQSKHAKQAGVDGLLHVTPYYNKPPQEGLYQHFAACAQATDLPIVLYNVPGRTQCDLAQDTLARLAELPTIVGIKDATGDMDRAADSARRFQDALTLSSGDDFTAFPFLCLGGHGVISVASNIVPKSMVALTKAARSGDVETARNLHHRLAPLFHLLFRESNPIPVKAALAKLGLIGPEIRLPLTTCSPQLADEIVGLIRSEELA